MSPTDEHNPSLVEETISSLRNENSELKSRLNSMEKTLDQILKRLAPQLNIVDKTPSQKPAESVSRAAPGSVFPRRDTLEGPEPIMAVEYPLSYVNSKKNPMESLY